MLNSFFDRFLIDVCSQLGPPEPLYWFYKHVWLCGIFNIRSNFKLILVPTWLHFGSQKTSKSCEKSIPRYIKKTTDFPSIFQTSWLHLGSQVGIMLATFSAQQGRRCEHQPSFFDGSVLSMWFFQLMGGRGRWVILIFDLFMASWHYAGPFLREIALSSRSIENDLEFLLVQASCTYLDGNDVS